MGNNDKALKRFFLISNGAFFQLLSAFSTAIVAYFVYEENSVEIWGQFASIWVVVSILTLVFNFGNKDFLLKEFSISNTNTKIISNQYMSLRLPLLIVSLFFLIAWFNFEKGIVLLPIIIATFFVNSFQPLLIFEKRFAFLLGSELLAITAQLLFLFYIKNSFNLAVLLISFLIYNLVKLLMMMSVFKKLMIPQIKIGFNFSALSPLLPFFLLTLGGLLINKSDLMLVAAFLSDSTKAQYQILSTFSTMGIIAAHALLQPFIKQIYRVNNNAFDKISKSYFLAGIVLSLLYVFMVLYITNYFFKIQLSSLSVILLYFIELVFFAINPHVFYIYRNDKQHHFVSIVLISGIISLLAAFFLVKQFDIQGALFANLLGNCVMLILLLNAKRKIYNQTLSDVVFESH
jgi:O-antigen/teichoic acid export membrane protein